MVALWRRASDLQIQVRNARFEQHGHFMLNIVLYEPEIRPNTGNIIRLCANTGSHLHLVAPLGLTMDDKCCVGPGSITARGNGWKFTPVGPLLSGARGPSGYLRSIPR